MPINSLPAVLTLLVALSVATERAVEILKSLVPWLDTVRPEPASEGRRRATIQALAVVFGVIIAYFSWPIIAQVVAQPQPKTPAPDISTILALGLLSSGGSGFWNSILGYVVSLKVLKGAEAKERVATASGGPLIPHPDEGTL
jgi:tellurite resistance protein TehA-like permease